MKKTRLLTMILLSSVTLAWCSDYNQSTLLKIQELEKQAIVLNTACNNLEKINQDINNLKGYIDNQSLPTITGTTSPVINKPISCTKTNYACLDWNTINIGENCWENYTKQENCWVFSDYGIESCYVSNNQSCLLNDDLGELNKLLGI